MSLSASDQRVLRALFDAESSLQTGIHISFEYHQTPGFTPESLKIIQGREASAIRLLNSNEPTRTEMEQAIASLTFLIEEYPDYASTYNNRAQAVRMLVGDDLHSPSVGSSSLHSDLCQAIQLASPTSKDIPYSPFQAKILASAYTHRGTILLKASHAGASQTDKGGLPRELRGLDSGVLKKIAEGDLQMGAKLGNQIAKNMSVQLNPYAKLCGQTVKAALLADIEESMIGMSIV